MFELLEWHIGIQRRIKINQPKTEKIIVKLNKKHAIFSV